MTPPAEVERPSSQAKPEPTAEAVPPPSPPPPARSPAAVMQVLDKVTAETFRFVVPVGRRVRYRTLFFTVRACETRDLDGAQPKPSAYILIETAAMRSPSGIGVPSRQLFKGWMFALAPSLHLLEHPVYDAWLVACSASVPVA